MKSKLTSQTKANESRDKEIEELTGEKDKCHAELQELQAACEELRVSMEKEKNFTKDAKKEVHVILVYRDYQTLQKKLLKSQYCVSLLQIFYLR